MTQDRLITCNVCGQEDSCYENIISDEMSLYSCFRCGFVSNSLMVEGNEFWNETLSNLPKFYQSLIYKDKQGKFWVPNNIDTEEGVVFVFPVDNGWGWSASKKIDISEEEKPRFFIKGKQYTRKVDTTSTKIFNPLYFSEALKYIGAW